jgi:hypothetical protein
MTDEPTSEARSNVLQFQITDARWMIEYRRNKAAFLLIARKILREEAREREYRIADRSAGMRERPERLGMYVASQEDGKESQ